MAQYSSRQRATKDTSEIRLPDDVLTLDQALAHAAELLRQAPVAAWQPVPGDWNSDEARGLAWKLLLASGRIEWRARIEVENSAGRASGWLYYFGERGLQKAWDALCRKLLACGFERVDSLRVKEKLYWRLTVVGYRERQKLGGEKRGWLPSLRSPKSCGTAVLLGVQKRVAGKANQPPAPAAPAHSDDFRSVNWFGTVYTFTRNQAAVVKLLWGHWERGTPAVDGQWLLEEAEIAQTKLVWVFRRHPAWGAMIRWDRKGKYWLAAPQNHP